MKGSKRRIEPLALFDAEVSRPI